MPKGVNPKSRENLKLGRRKGHGRSLDYDQPKRTHGVSVTDSAWEGLQSLAKREGIYISELLERIGRGKIKVVSEEDLENTPNDISFSQ